MLDLVLDELGDYYFFYSLFKFIVIIEDDRFFFKKLFEIWKIKRKFLDVCVKVISIIDLIMEIENDIFCFLISLSINFVIIV